MTNGLMATDRAYFEHLTQEEAPGRASAVVADHVLALCARGGVGTGRWLDVGCGSGYLLMQVIKAGFTPAGIEPGGWAQIAAAERKLPIVQGFLGPDTFTQPFDVVSATDVLEHVASPVAFLRMLSQQISPGGRIVITIPYAQSLEARLKGERWNMIDPPTHRQFFTRRSLDELLARTGLAIERRRRYHLRNMRGLGKYRLARRILDAAIPGPQLACLLTKS